jgi:hypothetical protein
VEFPTDAEATTAYDQLKGALDAKSRT